MYTVAHDIHGAPITQEPIHFLGIVATRNSFVGSFEVGMTDDMGALVPLPWAQMAAHLNSDGDPH